MIINGVRRQEGITTRLINSCPHGSIYVWCNNRTDYIKELINYLGRSDINVVTPSFLRMDRVRSVSSPVAIDHAIYFTDQICDAIGELDRRGYYLR